MATQITRSTWIDDDGSDQTGQVVGDAELQEIYDNIDELVNDDLELGGGLAWGGGAEIASSDEVLTGPVPAVQGVEFPGTPVPSSDPNVLDAYDEGSWTPVIGGAGGTSGQTYTTQVGRYVKIGRLVLAQCHVHLSAKGTITGLVQIQGLPFLTDNVTLLYVGATVPYFDSLATNWISLGGYANPNTQAVYIIGRQSAGASVTGLTTTDIGNTTSIVMSIMYRAAA